MHGIWHLYKYTLTLLYRQYLPIIACLLFPNFTTESLVPLHRKVPFMEKVVGALLVARSDFIVPMKDIITRLEAQRKPHPLATVVALHKVKALQRMLNVCCPAIFALGHGVQECMWACKNIETGYRARQVLLEALLVMIGLCGPDAKKVEYIHTTFIALLAWQQWHN